MSCLLLIIVWDLLGRGGGAAACHAPPPPRGRGHVVRGPALPPRRAPSGERGERRGAARAASAELLIASQTVHLKFSKESSPAEARRGETAVAVDAFATSRRLLAEARRPRWPQRPAKESLHKK